ncbi:TetR/AcrR family transcriptional regulator [Propionibacteriaceae bacterium Y2011]
MRTRAKPLPADERRAQIMAVAKPLIREHGINVTTRQIADAAGLAEGTLFRIFPTKSDLLHAVIASTFDPSDTCDAIDDIDHELDLPDRLAELIDILTEHVTEVAAVFPLLREIGHSGPDGHDPHRLREHQHEHQRMLTTAVADILKPDADRLRVPLTDAAAFVQSSVLLMSHPMMKHGCMDNPDNLITVLLYGIVHASEETS